MPPPRTVRFYSAGQPELLVKAWQWGLFLSLLLQSTSQSKWPPAVGEILRASNDTWVQGLCQPDILVAEIYKAVQRQEHEEGCLHEPIHGWTLVRLRNPDFNSMFSFVLNYYLYLATTHGLHLTRLAYWLDICSAWKREGQLGGHLPMASKHVTGDNITDSIDNCCDGWTAYWVESCWITLYHVESFCWIMFFILSLYNCWGSWCGPRSPNTRLHRCFPAWWGWNWAAARPILRCESKPDCTT